jgi:hypothetical protein
VQIDLAVSLVNLALRAWASLPFARAKEFLLSEDAGALAGAGAGFEDADDEEVEPPVFAPVVAMRVSLSAAVVQVMLVPGLRTKGSAAHMSPPPHGVITNLP